MWHLVTQTRPSCPLLQSTPLPPRFCLPCPPLIKFTWTLICLLQALLPSPYTCITLVLQILLPYPLRYPNTLLFFYVLCYLTSIFDAILTLLACVSSRFNSFRFNRRSAYPFPLFHHFLFFTFLFAPGLDNPQEQVITTCNRRTTKKLS